MTVGICMLVHEALDRTAQVARHWAMRGCPVVIHIDLKVSARRHEAFRRRLSDIDTIRFCRRFSCEWGTWSLVEASQCASEMMLQAFPEVDHVYLASGTCLPIRPVEEMIAYLETSKDTDFIESVTTEDVPWTVGGLDRERFTLRFPFSWKRQQKLFDRYVKLQRRFGLERKIPEGLVPHLGSQWWCLSRKTLDQILNSQKRAKHDRYFRRVWIPDESYYQTLARLYSSNIESRSLTLSKFDFQGKPHVFYDDHLQLLRRSDRYVARKIWPRANRLYDAFLSQTPETAPPSLPNPGQIDRVFAKAVDRRTRGRPGLYMHSRFPNDGWENSITAAPYTVLEGFGDVFEDLPGWLGRAIGARVHGHLYHPERAQFAGGERCCSGALSDYATLRDYNPIGFLTNLLWNTRGERQVFLFGPGDTQDITDFITRDRHASVLVISGAWAVPLFHSDRSFAEKRAMAARLQQIEGQHLDKLKSGRTKARVRIWTMADFAESPMEALQVLLDEIDPRNGRRLTEAPRMVDLAGFGDFLQELRNKGMNPHLMGDYRDGPDDASPARGRLTIVSERGA